MVDCISALGLQYKVGVSRRIKGSYIRASFEFVNDRKLEIALVKEADDSYIISVVSHNYSVHTTSLQDIGREMFNNGSLDLEYVGLVDYALCVLEWYLDAKEVKEYMI